MKAKLIGKVKKIAAVATGALFVGATLGMASVFASGLSNLGPTSSNQFLSNGHVNAVFVVGANSAPSDIAGAIDISAALTAAAAASHSSSVTGQISIGTLSLVSKANSVNEFGSNSSSLGLITPSSINLIANNFTAMWKGHVENYTSVENLTFLTSPTFNGLNVEFSKGAYELQSYIVNRSANGNKVELGKPMVGLNNSFATITNVSYYFGDAPFSVIKLNGTTAQFGKVATETNVIIPSSFTVGTNTINILGSVTNLVNASQSQIEVSVNGGAIKDIDLASSMTIGPVTITTPATIYEYSNGTRFLKTLTVSSIEYSQNISSSHVAVFPGLGSFNVTNGTSSFKFTATKGFTLPYSFTTASSFELPENLTSIDLQPLSHIYNTYGDNITLTVGAAKSDSIGVMPNKTTGGEYNVGSAVPNIGVGVGILYSGSTDIPSTIQFGKGSNAKGLHMTNILANNTLLYNVNGTSGDVAPGTSGVTSGVTIAFNSLSSSPAGVLNLAVTNATSEFNSSTFTPVMNISATPMLFYKLPNGQYLELHYANASIYNASSGTNHVVAHFENLTYILNFTASTTAAPSNFSIAYTGSNTTSSGQYRDYAGYNLTVTKTSISVSNGVPATAGNVSIKAPVASFAGNSGVSGSLVPGFAGIYANSKLNNYINVSSGSSATGILGKVAFNGSVFEFTDPLGETISAMVNSYPNGTTYFMSPANTSANTWGSYVTYKHDNVEFVIPTQNYTVAVAGKSVVTGQQNYTIGQTVGAGKLLGINGVSTVSASNLLNNNVDLVKFDTAFMPTASTTNAVPVIVIGGPAINTAAAELLFNSTTPEYGSAFTNATNVSSGEALVQLFSNVKAFNNEPALLIAGYSGNDTLEASQVVASFLIGEPITNVNMTGNKVILSASSAGYTGVKSLN